MPSFYGFSRLTRHYDENGNLVYIKETNRTGANREIENVYDKNNRLVRETITGSATRDTIYAYDSGNNRTTRTVNGAITGYSYNALNQLTGTTGAEIANYSYDANGNRIARTGTGGNATYAYDQENRLTSLTDSTGNYGYAYDYRTRRVLRNENSITTRIIYSGGTSYAEYVGASLATPSVEYIRGSDYGGGIGGILYTIRAGVPSYTHYNSRGDVTAKTSAAGTATYTAQYEAYGKRLAETGATLDRQRANTKDEDPTGLLNEGFRYRDLTTGTFLTRDPLGFVDGPNLYAYVVQNPWTHFDPEGLSQRQEYLDSAKQDAVDYYTTGSKWSYTKATAKVLGVTIVDVASLGTFAKNSTIEDEVNAGKMTLHDGMTQVGGNGVVAAGSLLAGGGAAQGLKAAGAGLISQGAAFGFTQAVTQIGGERAVAGATGGRYYGTPEGDVAQVGISTGLGGALGAAARVDAAIAVNRAASVATPHGLAVQANTTAARAALQQAQSGATVYRQGSFGVQNTADAQFWSFNNPARTPSYSRQMGMPAGATKPDWIMGGTVRINSPVVTRPAPGIGTNAGGKMEAVVPPGGVENTWFHMPE